METMEQYQQIGREIWNDLRLATYPVAIKYIKDESEIPEDFVQPSKVGESWALCQAITGQALAVDGGNTASLNLPGMKF